MKARRRLFREKKWRAPRKCRRGAWCLLPEGRVVFSRATQFFRWAPSAGLVRGNQRETTASSAFRRCLRVFTCLPICMGSQAIGEHRSTKPKSESSLQRVNSKRQSQTAPWPRRHGGLCAGSERDTGTGVTKVAACGLSHKELPHAWLPWGLLLKLTESGELPLPPTDIAVAWYQDQSLGTP